MNKAMKQGFTLIELMVVVIIVGILAAVAVPKMAANRSKSQSTEAIAACGSIKTAVSLFFVEKGAAPADIAALKTAKYLESDDLGGTYYQDGNYALTSCTGANDMVITVGEGLEDAPKVVYTVVAGSTTTALTDHS